MKDTQMDSTLEQVNQRPAIGTILWSECKTYTGEVIEHVGGYDAFRVRWDKWENESFTLTEFWNPITRKRHAIRLDPSDYPKVGDYLYVDEIGAYAVVTDDGRAAFLNPAHHGAALVVVRYLHDGTEDDFRWRPGSGENPGQVSRQEALQAVWGAMCSNVWEAIAVCAVVGKLQKVKDDLETESVIARGFQRDIKNYREESRRYLRVLEAHNIDDEAEIEAENY